MGVVYRAYDPRLKRSVALKLVAPELAADERFRERFLAESELAAALEHPHVVPVYDAGEVDGQLGIAMRYVEGSDLKTVLRQEGALPAARAVAICAQAADALDAAHKRGLVHRDVKPSNLLIDGDQHVYLADFGLTRRPGDQGMVAGPGLSLGTPAYAAPEQIQGADVDGRADVYSLGCLLYECLTGEVPFARDSELAVLWAHLEEQPPRPSERNPALPKAIDAVLAKALAKEPGERYATCSELVAAAADALGVRDVVLVRDRKPLLMALAGIVLAVAAGVAALLLSRSDGTSKPSTKPTPVPRTDALQRIDPKTNRLVATLTMGSDPTGVAVAEGAVWVIHVDENRISKIDPRTNAVVATGSAPGPKAVTVGGGSVWVANSDGTVTQLDAQSGASLRGVVVPSSLHPVELAAYGSGAVWVASPLTGYVARINPRSSSVTAAIDTGALKGALKGIAAGEGSVWTSSSNILAGDYSVSRVNPAMNRVVARARLRLGAEGISTGEGAVWVANSLGGTVSQIDPVTNRVVRTITVGRGPVGVAAGRGAVWVTNYRDGTISRVDPKRGRVVATISVGPNPDRIAVGEDAVWVAVHPR
jgi:YVTN family beta-propeller protein